jgi:hypothetical protein
MRRPGPDGKLASPGPGEVAFTHLREGVAACIAAGLFRIHPEVAAQVIWMSNHGLVSLLVTQKGFPSRRARH